ncbi:MAG: tRNA 2-selenouridine(34) synthase MnmH, partial [Rhodobacteraceae bacterium]|nr:tRNA 2-selenouridine(34) synthase MnmH [Paracoccaceae bacterium]
MPVRLDTLNDLAALTFDDIIDVRSPAEYAEDHIPGAISLPVLSNEERAKVGTIYVQEDRFLARKIGAALVARNAAIHLEGALADRTGEWRPLVYCWRGGQRSGSFTSILQQVGWRADIVTGGYKSYRRLVVRALYDTPVSHKVILIDGGTGTAKTRLLSHIAAQGGQVLDLEAMAEHRGSVFGPMGDQQPSQKAFESRLAMALVQLDLSRPVFVEAESSKIGRIILPPSLWKAMIQARVVVV